MAAPAERIHQPLDDAAWIVLQPDFPTPAAAEGFRQFLETRVWSSPAAAPGLAGVPRAPVLVDPPV